jgi:hypothetical protein
LLEGDEEGCAEILADAELADAELEGQVDGSDKRFEEGQLLKLGLLEVVEEGFAEILGDADGELEGRLDGTDDAGLKEGPLLN